MDRSNPLLEFREVKKWFPVQRGFAATLLARGKIDHVHAVDGVSFKIRRGEVFGLAGESGSGKTTVGRLALRLLAPTEGEVVFDGVRLSELNPGTMRQLRRRMQAIFQDPLASLNPRMTVGAGIGHSVRIHITQERTKQRQIVYEILERVGLSPPDFFFPKYPHQISGGQRQRVAIARALVTSPDLVVADEALAMADVSMRALLLDLMKRLKEELDLTYLFITHDLATAKYICDRIAIMYLGKIVELGPVEEVFKQPKHPYTAALLSAVPVPDPTARRQHLIPRGEIPNPIDPPPGCRFHPRCPFAEPICSEEEPDLLKTNGEHLAACHFSAELDLAPAPRT